MVSKLFAWEQGGGRGGVGGASRSPTQVGEGQPAAGAGEVRHRLLAGPGTEVAEEVPAAGLVGQVHRLAAAAQPSAYPLPACVGWQWRPHRFAVTQGHPVPPGSLAQAHVGRNGPGANFGATMGGCMLTPKTLVETVSVLVGGGG